MNACFVEPPGFQFQFAEFKSQPEFMGQIMIFFAFLYSGLHCCINSMDIAVPEHTAAVWLIMNI